jgi:broad specificity phosphatase PhoE
MGRLFVVRHAQASFLEPNYDKLSPLGETQARLLGEYWAGHEVTFDRAGTGPCVRQKETARLVSEAYKNARLDFPELLEMPEFDEYEGEAVLEQSLPQLLKTDREIRELYDIFQASPDAQARRKSFQKFYEIIIGRWVEGDILVQAVEPWHDFRARVNRGLTVFLNGSRQGERSVIFSSGGPIGLALQRALDLSPQNVLRASWMAQNCSFSEFLYSRDRFTLSTFNSFPHLDDRSLQTYR